MQELKFIGVKIPSYTIGSAVALCESGKIVYNGIISHMMPLAEMEYAFDMFVNQNYYLPCLIIAK
jgi:hypothetical protein